MPKGFQALVVLIAKGMSDCLARILLDLFFTPCMYFGGVVSQWLEHSIFFFYWPIYFDDDFLVLDDPGDLFVNCKFTTVKHI